MNVLFVTAWYPTSAHTYGGVFVREHAKAVSGAGHKVVVLHLANADPEGSLWTMEAELDPSLSGGIEAHHVFSYQSGVRGVSYVPYIWGAIGAYRRLRANGFRPDLIHAHVYVAGVPAAIIAARSGIPFVLTEHSSGIAQPPFSRVELRKAHYAYTRAARVLPVSHYLEEAIKSHGIEARFEVIPNAVDTSVFFPRRSERIEAELHRLLFVGTLEPSHVKGFPTLLRALGLLGQRRRDWQLDVIGDGPERERHEMSAVALGIRECVTFHGSCPKPVVAEMMRQATLLVQPSRVETFGAVVVEALASGLPVASTTVGGIPELVDERSGRLVPPDDPAALADALEDMLENLETFDGSAIAASAGGRYGLEAVGGRLDRIYQVVLEEAAAGAPAPGAAF